MSFGSSMRGSNMSDAASPAGPPKDDELPISPPPVEAGFSIRHRDIFSELPADIPSDPDQEGLAVSRSLDSADNVHEPDSGVQLPDGALVSDRSGESALKTPEAVPKPPDFALPSWFLEMASWRDSHQSFGMLSAISLLSFTAVGDVRSLFDIGFYARALSLLLLVQCGCGVIAWTADIASKFVGTGDGSWNSVLTIIASVARSIRCLAMPIHLQPRSIHDLRRDALCCAELLWAAQVWILDAVCVRNPVSTFILLLGLWAGAVVQPVLAWLAPLVIVVFLAAATHGLWQSSIGLAAAHTARDVLPAKWSSGIVAALEFDYSALPKAE